jgi:hypothetical protein
MQLVTNTNSDKYITHTDSIKDLGQLLDSKLFYHHHVNYIFPQSLKMLTSSFAVDISLLLYFTLEYALPAWNNNTPGNNLL